MYDFRKALKLIESHDTITIFGHALPDGDCYGTQIALRELLRLNYPQKKVYAIGSGLPAFFERLAPMDVVEDKVIAESLAIIVDVSCLRRVEDPRVFTAQAFLKFDHHQPNKEMEPFDGLSVSDPSRIAAAEIIAELAFGRKMKMNTLIAECLYLAMCTDSGHFTYFGTTRRTMHIVQKLKRYHIRIRSIEKIAYYEPPEVKKCKALIRAKHQKYQTVCYCVLTDKMCESCGLTPQKALRLVNALAPVHGDCHCYALFVYFPDGQINVELRSNKGYPVHGVAKAFGGGGHRFASGCTIDPNKTDVMEVVKALDVVVRENNVGA
ncbi:MAG: bifunctional oligoribonuclease/PAP phosphatase NrnA [Bacilli bacterium]|nr:bifunctional oligoribonuclease/PAP phosphatase NrnA [Bacilli bacterium]